jgi:hypothetical protein
MPWPEYRSPTIGAERLLSYIESIPDAPATRLPWLRRALWWAADRTSGMHAYFLSGLLHDIGWRLP